MRPCAPAAIAALLIGAIRSLLPVPWLGSAMTGNGVSLLRMGTALRSSVNLVWGLKLPPSGIMPLSQSRRFLLWLATILSAKLRYSSIWAAKDLLKRIGLPVLAVASMRSWLNMFL